MYTFTMAVSAAGTLGVCVWVAFIVNPAWVFLEFLGEESTRHKDWFLDGMVPELLRITGGGVLMVSALVLVIMSRIWVLIVDLMEPEVAGAASTGIVFGFTVFIGWAWIGILRITIPTIPEKAV